VGDPASVVSEGNPAAAFLTDRRCLENAKSPHHVAEAANSADQAGRGPVELEQHRFINRPLTFK